MVPVERVDVLVIGSGAAGLSVALGAAGRRVCVVSPQRIGTDGSSALAQGGIAAALGDDDSAALHAQDTLAAGAWQGDRDAVQRLVESAADTIDWLVSLGCPLDRTTDGRLALGLEAAHARRRIVHAGGDRSGALLMASLQQVAERCPAIDTRAGWRVIAPLLSARGVVGARLRTASGELHDILAGATVLASGGLTALFARHTGSPHADGAGHCFALEAGAGLRDLEFVQFHPTALALDDGPGTAAPLLTEALRGAGGRLRDADGRPLFLDSATDGGDLGPRDRVARAVFMAAAGGGAFLDLRGDPADTLAQRFPAAATLCRRVGIDPARQLLPVAPAAHYHMGGVAVDAGAATGVPGLYAVGEVAVSGVHGANRLASNSLLEALSFGRELGRQFACMVPDTASADGRLRVGAAVADRLAAHWRHRLGAILWRGAGPVRDARGLERGIEDLDRLAREAATDPAASARIRLAEALLRAALARSDSMGAHWRSDDPAQSRSGVSRAA